MRRLLENFARGTRGSLAPQGSFNDIFFSVGLRQFALNHDKLIKISIIFLIFNKSGILPYSRYIEMILKRLLNNRISISFVNNHLVIINDRRTKQFFYNSRFYLLKLSAIVKD